MSALPEPPGPAPRAPALRPPAGLRVRTVRLDDPVDLHAHVPPEASAVWMHHGQGMVAVGCAAAIRTRGEHRFREASLRFQRLASRSEIDDEVRGRGTGLVAFGSFSYAASSPRESTLMVPRAVLGSADGGSFLTLIADADDAETLADPLPAWQSLFAATPRGADAAVDLEPDHLPEEYQRLVTAAVARIRGGEVRKAVLSEGSTARLDREVAVSSLVSRLAGLYPTTWVYRVGDVLGASPEMLAQTHEGRVFSRVLAGTRSAADGAELTDGERRAFRADPKEREEHAYAVESVTARLADVADHLSVSEEPFVLRLPGIEHLASDVSARLRPGVTSLDVAGTLHPSAAVSGTPREDADRIIAELEPHDRGGYASPVGWMDAHGDGQWAIALRMAHLPDAAARTVRELRIQAGGGLVAASDAVSEHAEVLTKTRPVLRALRGDSPAG